MVAASSMLFSLPQPALSIVGSLHKFPLRRIYCIGRNFAEHAKEMGHNPDREPPFWFTKPPDAMTESKRIPYPTKTSNLHYEGELVVALNKTGRNLTSPKHAMDLVYGYAVGCDLTRRDLQADAKKMKRPWDASKGFDYSAPTSPIVPLNNTLLDDDTVLELSVNGTVQQSAPLSKMIWSVSETICHLSHFYTLEPGDAIMMGTPAGVGPLELGDSVKVTLSGQDILPSCEFRIVAE